MREILVVDDEPTIREIVVGSLEHHGFKVYTSPDAEQGLEFLIRHPIDIVITDLCMPKVSGLDFLKKILEIAPLTLVMVMTGFGSVEQAVTAMKLGAVDFIEKPFPMDGILKKIMEILEKQNLPGPREERSSFGRLIGNSKAMQNLYSMIEKVANSNASVLILGESGTGKDLVSREIHEHSQRRNNPFVVVNCAALVPTLLEDELFGHTKGAFTGAQMVKRGRFELANSGTIFLDEIAEIPVNLQTKLLRVLQEHAIERVGGTENILIDVRFIAATNRNLTDLLAVGQFREDLYYRLDVVTLKIPPLRERKSDISLIAQHYLAKYAQEHQKKIRFAHETLAKLQTLPWPGNVRQLQNVIQRGVILAETDVFTLRELGTNLNDMPQNIEVQQCLSRETPRGITTMRGYPSYMPPNFMNSMPLGNYSHSPPQDVPIQPPPIISAPNMPPPITSAPNMPPPITSASHTSTSHGTHTPIYPSNPTNTSTVSLPSTNTQTFLAGDVNMPLPHLLVSSNITEQLEGLEKTTILRVLEECNWNQTHVALKLGLKRTVLQYKMKKYQLSKNDH